MDVITGLLWLEYRTQTTIRSPWAQRSTPQIDGARRRVEEILFIRLTVDIADLETIDRMGVQSEHTYGNSG